MVFSSGSSICNRWSSIYFLYQQTSEKIGRTNRVSLEQLPDESSQESSLDNMKSSLQYQRTNSLLLDEVLPPLRSDIIIEIAQHEGEELLILRDELQLAPQELALDQDAVYILQKLDGTKSINDIAKELNTELGANVNVADLALLIRTLNDSLFIENSAYNEALDFLDSDVVYPVCVGTCYPESADELSEYLDKLLAESPERAYPQNAKAILAPHIDFRVNTSVYAPAFNAIKQSEFDVVVQIGTSHYGTQDRFILTNKNFLNPLGELQTDKELVQKLRDELPFELTTNDIAYMPEHSFEFHQILLKHIFPQKQFTILPILVTSFADFIGRNESQQSVKQPSSDERISIFCATLKKVLSESGKKPLFIISGDLAHIGKRFGDAWSAEEKLDELRTVDYEVMDAISKGDSRYFFNTIASVNDKNRVCGLPPVYTFLEAIKPGKSTVLGYEQWNDSPTGTAVSFGSCAWY
jgi:MEMO1 family protein